ALRAAFPREMAGLELDDEPIHIVNPDAPASNAQKGELMRLARLFGWNDQERHDRASVESFTELTKGEAGALIDEWRTFEADLIEDGVVPEAIGGEIVESDEPEDDDDGSTEVETAPLFDAITPSDENPLPSAPTHRYVGDGDGPCVFQIEPGTSCGWAREAHEGQGRLT
ncbi:MAG TPA: hypothetical protein VLE97_00990, partial [Gaiellaceae bacterium]|nr:hypothetical protein [Gaiellaceae bacterium]